MSGSNVRIWACEGTDVTWAGVDVGGRRKGFHVAIVDRHRLREPPVNLKDPDEVVVWLRRWRPRLVAVDSPRTPAPPGQRSRQEERAFAGAAICGLRYTPDARAIRANAHYEWVAHGLALYDALESAGFVAIECFPTASWTRWYGDREGPRAAWSTAALASRRLGHVPPRLSQDGRDAIAAALTARDYKRGRCEAFGDIVVPRGRGR
jgi:predicted nuclease with RNAse H fold